MPIAQYGNLNAIKIYSGIVCTIVPATKIDNRRGNFKTVAEFAPPLPASISPGALGSRYRVELGEQKVFSGIKVKIKESDNPALKGLTEINGNVIVSKVANDYQTDDGKGGKKFVSGDVAYRIDYDFKDPTTTFALGFAPSVTYYIDTKKHDLAANVIDTTKVGEDGGVAVVPRN